MRVDLKVPWEQERCFDDDDNNGLVFGIYTYQVPKKEIDTDNMLNNDVINTQWFKTEEERDRNFISEPYK